MYNKHHGFNKEMCVGRYFWKSESTHSRSWTLGLHNTITLPVQQKIKLPLPYL